MPDKPLINKKCLLQKYPGKGGWTYTSFPRDPEEKRGPFGWVKVKGFIDNYEIKNYKLMPMKNNMLFLPVRAAIRKKIGKGAGDYVTIVLFADNSHTEIPEEFLECLKDEPIAYRNFLNYTDGEQKEFIDWIFSAKTDETRVDRMAAAINKLALKKKFRDK